MNDYSAMESRINLLEYHQKLLIKMIAVPNLDFYRLVVENGISEQEVQDFFVFCESLNIKMEEQKAEGFVYFHPLFNELSSYLPTKLDAMEVVKACLNQGLFEPLFSEFIKCIR